MMHIAHLLLLGIVTQTAFLLRCCCPGLSQLQRTAVWCDASTQPMNVCACRGARPASGWANKGRRHDKILNTRKCYLFVQSIFDSNQQKLLLCSFNSCSADGISSIVVELSADGMGQTTSGILVRFSEHYVSVPA